MYTLTSPVSTGHVCSEECERGLPDRHAFAAFEVTCTNPECAAVELLECQDDLVFRGPDSASSWASLGWSCPHCGTHSVLEAYPTAVVDPAVWAAGAVIDGDTTEIDERLTACERTRAWRRYQLSVLEAAAR